MVAKKPIHIDRQRIKPPAVHERTSSSPVKRIYQHARRRETGEEKIEKRGGSPTLRFVPLGGLEEIGRNMMFYEYGTEIVVIDAGLQFPEEATPGVDYLIPNTTYLEQKKANVQALIITHAHYDHIGAIPYVMEKIGNPPIFTSALSAAIIKKRQEDFPNSPKLDIRIVKPRDIVKLSNYFEAEFFTVEHTIPDSLGIVLT